MYRKYITYVIAFIFFINIQTLKASDSAFGDFEVGLRCDEHYHLLDTASCFPQDAILQTDGTCECPTGGCKGCTADDFYCNAPINIMSNLANPANNLESKMRVYWHYEAFGHTNSCGSRDKRPIHCETAAAWGLGVGAFACLDTSNKQSGDSKSKTFTRKFSLSTRDTNSDNLEDRARDSNKTIERVYAPKGVDFGDEYYGFQPRLEFIRFSNGQTQPILRGYITQKDKHDFNHTLINIDSDSSDPNYFHFKNEEFSDLEMGFGVTHGIVWRPIQYCTDYDNDRNGKLLETDHDGGDGIKCFNPPVIKGLLVDENDSRKGLKFTPPVSESFFPNQLSLHRGGLFEIPAAPTIRWIVKDDSTFSHPEIKVTFVDASDNSDKNSTIDLEYLNRFTNHVHSFYNYGLYAAIIENNNVTEVPKLCVYACQQNGTGNCYATGTNENTGLALSDILNPNIPANATTEEIQDIMSELDSNKDIYRIDYSDAQECYSLPSIHGDSSNPAIRLSARGIGSNYDNPKLKVQITEKGKKTNEAILNLGLVDDANAVANLESTSFSYLINENSTSIISPHLFSIRQDLELEVPSIFNVFNSTETPTETNPITNIFYLCRFYNPDIDGGFKDECNYLSSASEDTKDMMCVHNLFPTPVWDNNSKVYERPHPYNVGSPLIRNDYAEYSENNSNLCIPLPKKILSFKHILLDNERDAPKSLITINYRKPKPFINFIKDTNGNYVLDNNNRPITNEDGPVVIDEILADELTGPGPTSGHTTITEHDFDYYNKFKLSFTNMQGIYCAKVSKSEHDNNWDTAQDIPTTASETEYCYNLNKCRADDPILASQVFGASFVQAEANTLDNIGICGTSTIIEPKADCDNYGNWANIRGKCGFTCPAVNFNGFSFAQTNTNGSDTAIPVTSASLECDYGFSGTHNATMNCNPNGNWDFSSFTENNQCEINCSTKIIGTDNSIHHKTIGNYADWQNIGVSEIREIEVPASCKAELFYEPNFWRTPLTLNAGNYNLTTQALKTYCDGEISIADDSGNWMTVNPPTKYCYHHADSSLGYSLHNDRIRDYRVSMGCSVRMHSKKNCSNYKGTMFPGATANARNDITSFGLGGITPQEAMWYQRFVRSLKISRTNSSTGQACTGTKSIQPNANVNYFYSYDVNNLATGASVTRSCSSYNYAFRGNDIDDYQSNVEGSVTLTCGANGTINATHNCILDCWPNRAQKNKAWVAHNSRVYIGVDRKGNSEHRHVYGLCENGIINESDVTTGNKHDVGKNHDDEPTHSNDKDDYKKAPGY